METTQAPFTSLPSGDQIARHFLSLPDHRNQPCNGFPLYQSGPDYRYVWLEALVDLDFIEHYLLDVRTKLGGAETRQYMYVHAGPQYAVEIQWHRETIDISDPHVMHVQRFRDGLLWFTAQVTAGKGYL